MSRLDQLLQFIQEDGTDPFLQFALAKEYEKLDNLDHALKTYLILYNDHSEYIGTYYHLGKLYEELDQNKEAIEVYTKGIELCREKKDMHALSELQGAKTNCELDL
jgi:tetratricopeptide (TPR) repeat protein